MSDRAVPSTLLPSELLIYIFDLATYGPARDIHALVELRPFEGDYSGDVDRLCDSQLKTKHALALTSSLFRKLSAPFLYEDIRVRHGCSEDLADALDKSPEIGPMVKRISIGLVGFEAADHWCASFPMGTRRILEHCPNVVILTRPLHIPLDTGDPQNYVFGLASLTTEINLDDVNLPHLRRIDWFNSPIDMLPATIPTPTFIWKSASVETLTFGSDYFPFQKNGASPIVELPRLRALRLRSINTPGFIDEPVDPETVRLPALRRLVFSLPDGVYTLFFEQFLRACGPRIETIEIAANPRFLKHDYISVLLLNCSNATTLNFPAFMTKPTRKNTRRQAVDIIYLITHVGLSAAGFQESSEDVGVEDSQWAVLSGHFLSLFGERTRFSKLERLTLYGEEWNGVLSDPRSKTALRMINSKHVRIECEHESVAGKMKAVSDDLDFLAD